MKSRWDILADRCVKNFETIDGARQSWANFVGAPKQRVTNFFVVRDRIPNAEVTLATLEWLNKVEKKK